MRFAVETWAPDYGSSVEPGALDDSTATVDLAVERPLDAWVPVDPVGGARGTVYFVDGVQRVDARVWVGDDGAQPRQGVCASWGAGVVRCNGTADVVVAEVRRGVLCAGDDVEPIVTAHGDYRAYPVPDDDGSGDPLGQALGRVRGDLEGRVAVEARAGGVAATGPMSAGDGDAGSGGGAVGGGGADRGDIGAVDAVLVPPGDDDLLVVDGPLGARRQIPGAVGYVKAHHVSYLPPAQQQVITRLAAGQRTPLFATGEQRFRYSWYLRLPGPATHAWWGVVRCEASGELSRDDAVALADRVTATLPRFASQPHNDTRAPQNLHPIAGLERELRRRLGDPLLLERSLRRAAAGTG